MEAWQDLDAEGFSQEYNRVWDRFENEFQFKPGQKPAIIEPAPSITYSISAGYGRSEMSRSYIVDLGTKVCSAFRECTRPDQRLYALDWQHKSFWFNPHAPFNANDPAAWHVPVFPDGDYYIFLAADFRFGTFGHPWEETICVFGQDLLDALERNQPKLFTSILRLNGQPGNP